MPPPNDAQTPACRRPARALTLLALMGLLGGAALGCGDDQLGASAGGGGATTDEYAFESKFEIGKGAVAHSGQSFRHVLITSLDEYISGLTAQLDSDAFNPTDPQTVMLALNYFYTFDDSTSADDAHHLTTHPSALQTRFRDISRGKDLASKMAGNDAVTDHRDWSSAFIGWSDASIATHGGGVATPAALLTAFFSTLSRLAVDRENGIVPTQPGTSIPIKHVYVTADGRDLRQLIHKLLLMGVAYSQGCDDYLDDDVVGKGLLATNVQDGNKPYSALGHGWDEAFGYFGAARDYGQYSDDEIAAKGGRAAWRGMHDTNGDGAIDLLREINWGASVNAAKRDRGASGEWDLTGDVFRAFYRGRKLILTAGAPLSADQLTALRGHAHAAVDGWERAIAATVVHYLNEVIADTQRIDTANYKYLDAAKHWSELKGFALGLQFNPRSKLSAATFKQLHHAIGDAPVLATASAQQKADYVAALGGARGLMKTAYDFPQTDVDGW